MPEHARSTLSPLSPLKPLSEALLFASNFLRHPNMLGSIIPSSRFLVDFVRFLRRTFPDPRLHVVHDSAAEVQPVLMRLGLPAPRYIISGIPLGSMPDPVRTDIALKTRAALEPGGAFLVYQFTARALPALQRTFGDVRRSFERRNFPPAQLFLCTAGGG